MLKYPSRDTQLVGGRIRMEETQVPPITVLRLFGGSAAVVIGCGLESRPHFTRSVKNQFRHQGECIRKAVMRGTGSHR